MAGQNKQLTRNRKIEPLNWAETANSPALKGMMSFLDIKPEEVRSGHFKDVPTEPDARLDPVSESHTGGESPTPDRPKSQPVPVIEIRPKGSVKKIIAAADVLSVSGDVPVGESLPGSDSYPISVTQPISDSQTGSDSLTGERPLGVRETRTVSDIPPVSETHPVGVSLPRVILGSVPSQNRKIRKCRLSQDAHSAGEEMLYRILWEEGKPENQSNPLGSRLVRIGYAELANKARMHKANVRLNLANLTAKLAIQQSGDFSSRDMIAKAYRVLSYKEILERRRASGLEFVIRQKNVVFVTSTGESIPLPGLTQKGKRKREEEAIEGSTPDTKQRVSDTLPISETRTGSVALTPGGPSFDLQEDLQHVSQVLNLYWTVDDAAADQLIRACRSVRSDAEADEIAFFVREKLELTRSNRSINNPIGLILATVPQSFSGYSFETFRKRRQESKKLAEEEKLRKAEEDRLLRQWIVRDAEKTLANPNSNKKRRLEAQETIVLYSGEEAQT